jgi:peptidoglycan/xylan/chitin deacetylase (PgdA/CDA1 family)
MTVYAMAQPEWLVNIMNQVTSSDVIFAVETHQPMIALTIDDGPDSETTPQLLDLLAEYDAHATFFVISNNIPGNESLMQRLVDEGHELGNHLTLDQPSIRLSPEEFEQELLEAEANLAVYAQPTWFRPGSGWYSDEMIAQAKQHGYRTALGSVYPFDVRLPYPGFATRFILWRARPGAIIILHDGGDRGVNTALTLADILPVLQERGFQIVTLSTLVESAQ